MHFYRKDLVPLWAAGAILLLTVLYSVATTNLSAWVFPGSSGRLNYQPDYLGNRVVDASGVGYRAGTQPLPSSNTVPVRVSISPVAGDNTANIQNAINQVSAMPLDANGFRGAVLLNAGIYPCSNTITISASGVVLRGVGATTNGTGTVLQAAAANQLTLVKITGSGSASTSNTHNITNHYVPVGARSFNVDSTSGFAIGDHVFVRRVATEEWIHDIGMDLLTNAWTPDSYMIDMDRIITRIEGNRVFVDAPVTCSIDQGYTNGTIREYAWSGRISNCGIEHIYGRSDYFGNTTNENHGWIFVQFNNIENAWARDLVSQYFGYSCVSLDSGAKWITVSDCQCLDPISIITGGRRYAFVMDDNQMCLVRNCYTRQDRHQFVTQSLTIGPNLFVDGLSDSAHAEAGPHHRWATAALWDNITVNGHDLDAQNTCESGTGHGWEGANCVIWNSKANNLKVGSPPGARNWLIGSIGTVSAGGSCHGIAPGQGTYDSSGPSTSGGTNVYPNSLYFAELQDRLAAPNLQTREYWLGEITSFTNGPESVPVDNAWRTAVQAAAGGQSLDSFDVVTNNHWVPFTFNFSLSATDQIIGATLSLSMRATNSGAADVLYLDSLTNVFSLAALNWLPISTSPYASNPSVRVLDLGPQINLLTNGQLNVAIQGDIGVDWALLELHVAPVANTTTTILGPVADATVRAGIYAVTNFGTNTTLTTKNDSTPDNTRQAYLRWDLTGVTQTVYQARVRLTPVGVSTNGNEQGVAISSSNNWTESGITWSNQPGRGERFATWIPATNVPLTFDVTPQVLDAMANDKQLSIQLFGIRNVGAAGNVDYASREYADTNSRPQLILTTVTQAISHPPGAMIWNGPGAGANNWSAPGNWLGGAAPEMFDDVKFFDAGASGVAVSNINNVVDGAFSGSIASLQYGNTNGNHTTSIAAGKTLTVSGTNHFIVGTETDNGAGQTVFATVTGTSGTLNVNSPQAGLIVRQGTANSGGSQRATFDLSGLGSFNATINQVLIGVAGPVNRPTGTLYLGKTNTVTAIGSPGILMGDSSSNTGGQNLFYLGQANWLFVDSVTVARQKANASIRFNPALANPTATFRGSDSLSRVSSWMIADNSAQSTSSSSALGTNDFSGGRLDALVDAIVLGKSQKTTGANSIGVLTFNAGTVDVNTLQVGFQAQSGATSAGIGRVNVNGTATLSLNATLELGHTSGGAGMTNTFGELFVNGGTILANSITTGAGSVSNTIAISGGQLVISNSAGTLALPINNVGLTNAVLGFSIGSGRTNLVAASLTTGGASNLINIVSLPAIAVFPAQFPIIKYSAPIHGAGYDFVLGSIPSGSTYRASLSNDVANGTIDLIVMPPKPSITGIVLAGPNVIISGTNGTATGMYYVLGSTNLIDPLASWSRIQTNAFDGSGNFVFTNLVDPTMAQFFYRIQVL
jgi:hypothetical protein